MTKIHLFTICLFGVIATSCATAQQPDVPSVAPSNDVVETEAEKFWGQAIRLVEQNRWDESLDFVDKALDAEREQFGPNSPQVVQSLRSMVETCQNAGRWKKSVIYLEQMVTSLGRAKAPEWALVNAKVQLKRAKSISGLSDKQLQELLGCVDLEARSRELAGNGQVIPALNLLRRSSDIFLRILGPSSLEYATNMNNQGELVRQLGDLQSALKLFSKSAELTRQNYGDQHPEYATTISNVAHVLSSLGDRKRAESLAKKAVEITLAAYGESDPLCGERLNVLAAVYFNGGDYQTALSVYQTAEKILRESAGETTPAYLTTANDLGITYLKLDRLKEGEQWIGRVLNLRKKVLGEDHPDYAISLDSLAMTYSDLGRYDNALELFNQALRSWRLIFGKRHPNVAMALFNVGAIYLQLGDYIQAETFYDNAIDCILASEGESHPFYVRFLSGRAYLHMLLAEYVEAEQLYQKTTRVLAQQVGERHPDYAVALKSRANLFKLMGKYDRALALYREAVEILREKPGPSHSIYAFAIADLASALVKAGEFREAESLFLESRNIIRNVFGEMNESYATNSNNLGEVYRATDQLQLAEKYFSEAESIRKTLLGEDHPDYASAISNLALVYLATGRYRNAEELMQKSLKVRQRAFGIGNPKTIPALHNLAACYVVREDYERAEPLQRQALDIAVQLVEEASVALTEQQQLALAQEHRALLDGYLSTLARLKSKGDVAFDALLTWKGSVLMRQRAARLAAANPAVKPLFEQLQHVVQAVSNADDPSTRTKWLEEKERLELQINQASGGNYLATRRESLKEVLKSVPPNTVIVDFTEYVDSRWIDRWPVGLVGIMLEDVETKIRVGALHEEGSAAKSTKIKVGDHVLAVADSDNEWRSTSGRDVAEVFDWIAGPAGSTVTLKLGRPNATEPVTVTIQREKLPYRDWINEQSLIALIARPGMPTELVTLGPADRIRPLIEAWRNSILSVDASGTQRLGTALRTAVWDPLKPFLDDQATIIICPDGPIAQLPFSALPGDAPGKYLIEEFKIATVAVPRLIPALMERTQTPLPKANVLLLGGVDFGEASDQADPWLELPGTRAEVEVLSEVYAQRSEDAWTHVLTGLDATESMLRKQMPNAQILHFATHGRFREIEIPTNRASMIGGIAAGGFSSGYYRPDTVTLSESGLVLANANVPENDGDDGLLMQEEILALPLDRSELVILSACNTGQGSSYSGEGLLGIQRAFQIAGAPTTVASLWKVDDLYTQMLMVQFHRNLVRGDVSRIDALRNAQLWLLKLSRERRAKVHAYLAERNERTRAAKVIARRPRKIDTDQLPPYYWAAFTLSGDWR